MNVFFESDNNTQTYIIENQNYQAGIILDVAHIKNGELVDFIPEKPSKKPEQPTIQPDVFWKLKENK
ncbi:hypothetical protein [Pedobacter alpinus]|uniref:Phage protein n=1 Tax=Pedobacter alpinus TaxID=1590643 RepID=A0ABW5TUF5_9SPHI